MKEKALLQFAVACASVVFVAASGGQEQASHDLGPRDLVELVMANEGRFVALDLSISEEGHATSSGGDAYELVLTAATTLLWTPHHSYSRTETADIVREWEKTDRWLKHLDSENGKPPFGRVRSGASLSEHPDGSPIKDGIWDFFGFPWDFIMEKADTLDVTWKPDVEAYVLTLDMGHRMFSMTIDPKFGYMPVSKTLTLGSGAVLGSYELLDFREVQPGLWLPHEIIFEGHDLGAHESTKNVWRIERAAVNVDIAEERMVLTFPPKTVVDDRIVGETYVIGELPPGDVLDPGAVYREDLYVAATDDELAAVAEGLAVMGGTASRSDMRPDVEWTAFATGLAAVILVVVLGGVVASRRRRRARDEG